MDSDNKSKYSQDMIRNKYGKNTKIYLWAYRTMCSQSWSLFKIPAKFVIDMFKFFGIGIQTKHIGGGIRMPHLNGIYIHENAILGENCTIFHQVTIGVNDRGVNPKAAPIIGNNVFIGAGAKIIGGVTIGDDVTIGANAVVTKSVPSCKKVVGYNRVLLE